MAELFSEEGLMERQGAIENLALQCGFYPSHHLGPDKRCQILFLFFRPEAPKIIMVISGTHGVEGPAGYDLQLDLLEKKIHEKLPKDVGLVFVVALNPWGWVHGRRTDENNVDLNRNGWSSNPPDLPPLDPEINALVNPDECDEPWYRKLATCLTDPVATARLRSQVFRGQHDNPKGVFYGGRECAWSLAELEIFCRNSFADTCRQLAVLDIHTGLGEWGEITLISSAGKGDEALIKRCKSWFGLNVAFPNLGQTDTINAVSSDLLTFLARCLPEAEVTALAVEIGTYPFAESFPLFVAENCSYYHPEQKVFCEGSGLCDSVLMRQRFQQHWYPPFQSVLTGEQWSAATCAGFGPIFRTALRGLSE